MKNLRIAIFTFALEKPGQLKAGLFFAGVLAGIIDSWYVGQDAMVLTTNGLIVLLLISSITYTVLLTLYRIIQRIFRIGSGLPESVRDFDERNLVRDIGLFGVVPFGLTIQVMGILAATELGGFGSVIIVQGLSIYLAARTSQFIKNRKPE